MPRPRRSFETATSYHVTMRCNNQAFDLRRPQARKVILFCLARAKEKFGFDLGLPPATIPARESESGRSGQPVG